MKIRVVTPAMTTLAFLVAVAGCTPSQEVDAGAKRAAPAGGSASCKHPYPCGDEWPKGLEGPFELVRPIQSIQVTAHDGVVLDGWVALPNVPAGTRVPTLYLPSPYYDSFTLPGSPHRNPTAEYGVPEEASAADVQNVSSWWGENGSYDGNDLSGGIPPIHWIRRGYALAYVSTRGTGNSGGCFGKGGVDEEADHGDVMNWIVAQPWSSGRIGIVGYSYGSYVSWQAASLGHPALKAIATGGDLVDFYQQIYSPEGARSSGWDNYYNAYREILSAASGAFSARPGFVAQRACLDSLVATADSEQALVTGDRNAEYFEARSYSRRLADMNVAVLDTGGFFDMGPHQFQDSTVWAALPASTPKVQVRGWWGHGLPLVPLDFPSGATDWESFVTAWFDYWLKGVGPQPRLDVVYHADQTGTWHEARGWSPEPRKKEALYLADGSLDATPSDSSATFFSAPNPLDATFGQTAGNVFFAGNVPVDNSAKASLCADPAGTLSHVYTTTVLQADALIAGNPMVYLDLASDQGGGMVTAELFDLAPEFACAGTVATGARWIAMGSADLNYYLSPYLAQPFAPDTKTGVRVDLTDTSYALKAGHRLALVLSHGEAATERSDGTTFANLTIFGDSQVVVPVAEGTVGGRHPTTRFPQRPFTPKGYRD